MQIEAVEGTTADEALLLALHLVESEADERPGVKRSADEAIASYRNPGDAVRKRWLATIAGEPAGAAFLSDYGSSLVVGYVLVRPAFRRRGLGRALLETLVHQAREDGIRSFFGEHVGAAAAAFARSVGAREDQRHVVSALDLRAAALPAPASPDGIVLRSWLGACPAALLESFVRARNGMSDAPVPAGQDMPTWTVGSQRSDESRWAARSHDVLTTVALEAEEVVALTGVRVPPAPAAEALTDDTTTVAAHRGRGLALAVKLENLRRLREERGDVERVMTRNAEINAGILAVNARIGFVPVATLSTAVVMP